MPKIDIIIPVYNQADKIGSCLMSIFKQTFKDFLIYVVDDGSTDKLDKALEKYKDKIKIIKQENKGANSARNRGAKEAKSNFIIFCDADIVLKPKMLERMYNGLLQYKRAAYAYSSFRYGIKTFKLWPFDLQRLKKMPYIHTTSLIRRKFFPGFDLKIMRLQDWDLWLTMLDNGHTGIWIPEVLFKIKIGGSMSKWMPSFAYRILKKNKNVIRYNQAIKIIKKKHNLP